MNPNQSYHPGSNELTRYFSGEMEPDELLAFEDLLDANGKLREEFDETAQIWHLTNMVAGQSKGPVNTRGAWEKFSARIEPTQALNDEKQHRVWHVVVPQLVKWAAAVIVTVGLGWLTYLAWNPPADNSLIVFDNPTYENTLVKVLHDGSLVYLSGRSKVEYPTEFNSDERSVVMRGEAFFDVTHHPGKPFRIMAGNAKIEVLGTSFNVKSNNDDHLELFVETGKVVVTSPQAARRLFTVLPGQLLVIRNSQATLDSPESYNTNWRKNMLSFRDEKLENIFHVIGKTYGYTLIANSEPLKNRIMTLTISDTSLQHISEMVALSLGANFEIRNDTVALFRNR